MAEGIRSRAGTNVGVGITGIAGPGGGTRGETGRARSRSPSSSTTRRRVRTFQFIGGREMVKFQAAQAALNMLRLMLLTASPAWREWSRAKVQRGSPRADLTGT